MVKLNDGESMQAGDIVRKALALSGDTAASWNSAEQDFRDFYIHEILEGLDLAQE